MLWCWHNFELIAVYNLETYKRGGVYEGINRAYYRVGLVFRFRAK
jgi:hypothetical protein